MKSYVYKPYDFMMRMQKDGIHDLDEIFSHPSNIKSPNRKRQTISALTEGNTDSSTNMSMSSIVHHPEASPQQDLLANETADGDEVRLVPARYTG